MQFFTWCWRGIKTAGKCIKTVAGWLCCLCITGPILVLIGIILLAIPNNQKQQLDDYNKGVEDYTETDYDKFENKVKIGGVTATKTPNSVNLDNKKATKKKSYCLLATTSVYPPKYKYDGNEMTLPTKKKGLGDSIKITCPNSKTCANEKDSCTGQYTGSSGNCKVGETCGYCAPENYLSKYNFIISKNGKFKEGFEYKSPKYENGKSGETAIYCAFLENDPQVVLIRVTKGKDSFGFSRAQQWTIGIALIVIGVVFILCVFGVAYLLYWLLKQAYGAYKANSIPQPVYPQQQQGYPQQQQGYPQQQGYGYPPQPGY